MRYIFVLAILGQIYSSIARAVPAHSSNGLEAWRQEQAYPIGLLSKRVELPEPEPDPASKPDPGPQNPTDPGAPTNPQDPPGTKNPPSPQDAPGTNPKNPNTPQDPSQQPAPAPAPAPPSSDTLTIVQSEDPLSGTILTPEQYLQKGTITIAALHEANGGKQSDKFLPDFNAHYDNKQHLNMEISEDPSITDLIQNAGLQGVSGWQRNGFFSKNDESEGAVLSIQSQPDQGAIIVNLMNRQADKNSPDDRIYASDLMMSGWTSAGGIPSSLKSVIQEDITNVGTQDSIENAVEKISPNWIPDKGPVELRADSTDPEVQEQFNILAGTDYVVVSTRMFTDYSNQLNKKSLISIKIWHDFDEDDETAANFGMWLQYG